MITAKEAQQLSNKGDPERALIIIDSKIREAAKSENTHTRVEFSKHLYSYWVLEKVRDELEELGYNCPPISVPYGEGLNYTIVVQW